MKGKRVMIGGIVVLIGLGLASSFGYAQQAKVFKWRAQSVFLPGTVSFKSQEIALQHLRETTGGRLDIKLSGPGTLVGPFQSLEACGKGVFEAIHHSGGFATGLDAGFGPLFSAPGLWDHPREVREWMEGFGGRKIFEEAYAKYHVYFAGTTLIGAEPIMSKVPLRRLEDFKGKKIRTPAGLTSMIFAKLGASPVPLPAGEIYSALETGVIDAAEFVTLADDYGAALHEVTKSFLWPSFHGPIGTTDWGVNLEAWKKLPPDLQAAFRAMVFEADYRNEIMAAVADYEAFKKMKAKGLEHTQLSVSDMEKVKKLSLDVAMEYKGKSPLAGKTITSIVDYLKATGKLK